MKLPLILLALVIFAAVVVAVVVACRRGPHTAVPTRAKADRAAIVPRIKHTNFLAALQRMNPKPEFMPVTEPLVADLLVTYALDLAETYQMFTVHDMNQLGMTPAEVRSVAIANLRERVREVRTEDMSPLFMLVTGGDYEACLLLLDEIWEPCARKVSGEFVVSVATRDLVIFTGSDSKAGMQVIQEGIVEAQKKEKTHSLTQHLLTRRDGRWEIFE